MQVTRKTTAQLKAEKFILTTIDQSNGLFPKIDKGLASERLLTSSLGETYVFDGRDNPDQKVTYYNAVYKGIASFTAFPL
ncbi:hypothetical protein [Spirosoma sp.]|uniref:hypothetical protein n=1 Tax=Spirosoma sp. TaxID=1899569 RepID=UPI002634C95F|nr:hypothetical protein [Spirosoma sp.]MCX6217567.1 hypothetical protein [Spirosoma sp.]